MSGVCCKGAAERERGAGGRGAASVRTKPSTTYLITRAQRRHSNFMRKVRKLSVGKHGRVSKKLVADVRLWCVERLAVVADVLGRVEHAESKSVEELPS